MIKAVSQIRGPPDAGVFCAARDAFLQSSNN